MQRIGLISDTHGLLRPEALTFLQGCDRILHMGDICDGSVLDRLRQLAPLTAVRGNNDIGTWADDLPVAQALDIESVSLQMIHNVADLDPGSLAKGSIVLHGHSHKPAVVDRDGVTFINPGSAGPRRFSLPISIGELFIDGTRATPRLVTLVP
jgi:uncharacterized protein